MKENEKKRQALAIALWDMDDVSSFYAHAAGDCQMCCLPGGNVLSAGADGEIKMYVNGAATLFLRTLRSRLVGAPGLHAGRGAQHKPGLTHAPHAALCLPLPVYAAHMFRHDATSAEVESVQPHEESITALAVSQKVNNVGLASRTGPD